MGKLFRSRKFLTMVLDLVVALVVYFVTKYVAPGAAEDVLFVLGALQPVVLAVIVMWGVEDAALKRAGAFMHDERAELTVTKLGGSDG